MLALTRVLAVRRLGSSGTLMLAVAPRYSSSSASGVTKADDLHGLPANYPKRWRDLPPFPPSRYQWAPPKDEKGYFRYAVNSGKDTRYRPLPGWHQDTLLRYFVYNIINHKEMYVLFGCIVLWFVWFLFVTYKSFWKIEVWLDRTQTLPPHDWERCNPNAKRPYFWYHMKLYDTNGVLKHRDPMMERMNDELLAAAKARGNR